MNTQKSRSVWHVYIRNGTAYIPNVARTEAGFYMGIEPVRIITLDDFPSLASAIGQAMASGNPQVPTPTRDDYKKPFLINVSGVKTWKAFERKGACFTIFLDDKQLEISESGRNEEGGWVDDPSLSQTLAVNSSAKEIAKCIIERVAKRSDLS
jgi:hypothetical protein